MHAPLLITMGDPTGVGPEIIAKALVSGALDAVARPLQVIGDSGVMLRAAHLFAADAVIEATQTGGLLIVGGRRLAIESLSALPAPDLVYGQPDAACGAAMADYVVHAAKRCLNGTAAGLVTAPINKAAIHAAGIPFPGHTELLADLCGVKKVVMMLAGDTLKVCLVTTHLAYADVPQALSIKGILDTIHIVDSSFRRQFGLVQPRIGVLALNPHAGEGGLFGDEEQRLIVPAIAAAQAEGIAASGPHSADTYLHFAARGACDAVVCMYHDQGLIPLKLLHFDDGVNVTLGLPIVRTSVDHGTAYDIAGTGQASTASLVAAIKMALLMTTENP
jgi:4-hydroxythreonine-4-phosphate dehydrogenase